MIDFDRSAFTTFSLDSLDLHEIEALENAILISLFTDKRVESEIEKRGYWADVVNENSEKTGSELWLLARSKLDEETKELASQYVRDSLSWLIPAGIAKSVDVDVEALRGSLILNLSIYIGCDQVKQYRINASSGGAHGIS